MVNTGPNGNLGHDQTGAASQDLQNLPGYQDALSGKVNAGSFPVGPDGLVLPGYREMNARYFGEQHGVNLGSGSHIDKGGDVHAVNDQAWYTDPRWLGPIAVGAASLGAGALGGASSGATSAATTAAENGSYIGSDVASTAASALGGHSALSTALGIGSKVKGLASVLGGASKDQAASKAMAARNELDWQRLNLDAPGKKLSSSLAAALTKDYTPSTLHWGGPGSGLRGETPTYSGGAKDALTAAKNDPAVAKLLQDVLNGKAGIPNPQAAGGAGHESLLDKILGGAAFGTSVLGAIR